MYAKALREVVRAMRAPHSADAVNESMMSTIMMLSVYEMYARTTRDAWVVHANGVKRLMLTQGVKAYESGFGRSCYIAFRGFLIATAIYEGQPCFLEREEWQKFASLIRVEDAQKPGEWSAFVDISELAFMEIAKCPRYLSEARSLTSSSSSHAPGAATAADDLVLRMRETCRRLVGITTELRGCISAHSQRQQGIAYRPGSFVGPVPRVFPETSPSLLLRGAEATVAALEQLMTRLREQTHTSITVPRVQDVDIPPTPETSPDEFPPSVAGASASASARAKTGKGKEKDSFTLPFRVVSEIGLGPSKTSDKNDPRAVIWLDRVASSMGMLGTEVVQDAVPTAGSGPQIGGSGRTGQGSSTASESTGVVEEVYD